MIAAIYARKSTEQNVTDDAKSVRVDLSSGAVVNVGPVSRQVAGRVLNERGSVGSVWVPPG